MPHPARKFLDAIELPNHGAADLFARLESAAQNAATSAYSRNPPTLAQRAASDYVMGHINLHGMSVRIENPRNTYREKADKGGKVWRSRMAAHYGDIEGTRGNDGDPIDVFVGPFPESTAVWVINQRRVGTDKLDEHKAMLGFVSEQQARNAYLDSYDRGWTGLMSIVRATINQFKAWLKSGDMSRPFSLDQLPAEGNIMQKVLWNKDAEPTTTDLNRLMYDLRVNDGKDGLLLDSATMADLMGDPDIEGVIALDALVVEVGRMSLKMDMLKKVMEAAGNTVKPTDVTISDPVKARGVLQVMVLFQMSDGQTIAIWFHNPDTTPAKLMPLDELISWKWMLNKKDVTIVVAPERGKDLNIREVARRVMRLVERNTDAYQKANAKAGERAAESQALDTEITGLEGELTGLQRQIEVAKVKQEDAAAAITRKISALQAEQARVFDLFEKEKLFGAAADKVKIESLLNSNDDLADEIRALHGEAAAGRSSWQQWQALRAAEAARNTPAIDPTTPEGYAQVMADPLLQIKYQDELDSMFTARIVEVRNALRALGWEGIRDMSSDLTKDGFNTGHRVEAAGPGKNVVGVVYYLTGGEDGTPLFDDDLTKTTAELAAQINESVAQAIPAPVAPAAMSEKEAASDAALRALWTEQGVPQARQDELIAQIVVKAQPDAKIGPFSIGEDTPQVKEGHQLLAETLKRGELTAAVALLNGLSNKDMQAALLYAGFSVTGGSKKEILADVSPRLIQAALKKTDGFGLRQQTVDTPPVLAAQPDYPEAPEGWTMEVHPGSADELTPEGRESKVKTAKGTEVVTGFAVVEASRLITSHDPATGDVNPEFPQDLQPRDRARETSRAWVLKTAANLDPEQLGKTRRADTGAPIVGKDRVVESGNGRTMAIIEAYRTGKADEYRAWLESEADYFGLSAEKIKGMKRPVLVRVRTSAVNRAEFAVEANQDDKLAMTATEKARADANRLTEDMISLMTDNGDLNATANTAFLSAFLRSLGDAEAAQYSTSEGKPTSSLIARVQAAIFAKAYNDDRLLELTADAAKPEIANIISALNFAAPEFIQSAALDPVAAGGVTKRLTDSIEASLNEQAVNAIIGATNVIKQAKESGMQVDEFIKQQGLFGDLDPNVAAMAVFIAKNNRSAKRMGAAFKAMATFVKGEIERRQTADMFGEPVPIGFPEIIAAANRELDRAFGEGAFAIETVDLFARPAEPAQAKVKTPIEPLTPASNPAKDADTAYLQSLVDGTADMFASDVFGRLEPMFTAYEADADMMALLERAAQAYGDAAVKAAREALATA